MERLTQRELSSQRAAHKMTLKDEWRVVAPNVLPRRDGVLFGFLTPFSWVLLNVVFGVPVLASQIGCGALLAVISYYLPPRPLTSFTRWVTLVVTLYGSLAVAFWWLPKLLGTVLPWYFAYGLSLLALLLWARFTPTIKEFRRLNAPPKLSEREAIKRARDFAAVQGWTWIEPPLTVWRESWFSGSGRWEVFSNASGVGAQVRVVIDERTGEITDKDYVPS